MIDSSVPAGELEQAQGELDRATSAAVLKSAMGPIAAGCPAGR
jgi:hypothetical protein